MEWETGITKVEPNHLTVRGHALQELIGSHSLMETVHLLIKSQLPDGQEVRELEAIAVKAAREPSPQLGHDPREDVSKALSRCIIMDELLVDHKGTEAELTAFTLGRMCAYLAGMFGNIGSVSDLPDEAGFIDCISAALIPQETDRNKARMLEAMMVASVDHGVTPPSAQATILAATVRSTYEVAIAHGVGAITDVHGGAGSAAASFFRECVGSASTTDLEEAVEKQLRAHLDSGKRVKGLGHRIHDEDPRRDAIWKLADDLNISGEHVRASRMVGGIFESVKGRSLPINVDGVIGAVVADMGLEPAMAKVVFIIGRTAGLSAHYFEEVSTQKPMRRVDFSKASYVGPEP